MNSNLYTILISFVIVFAGFAAPAHAQDWPHWMGPNRTNTWLETGIIDEFPEGGPKVLWRQPINYGYSGPAVANGKLFITDFVTEANVLIGNFERREFDGTERVLCLDKDTGKVQWKHEYPVRYTISYPSGPRCTPVVEENRVYTLGAEGHLFCFNVDDGKVIWSKELKTEYKTKSALWGYAAHPLIDGENLITLAGGDGSHLVALNKKTGEEVWRSLTAPEQGYSPPTIIDAGGQRQLITLRPDAVTSLNPESGKENWSVPYEATSGSIIMSPVHFDDYLYVAGYSRKSMLLKLGKDKPSAEIVWQDKARDVISPVNVQPFFDNEEKVLYGMDQSGEMRATKLPEGELLWSTTEPGSSERRVSNATVFIVRQADRYWLFNDIGDLIIAKMTPKGYTEIDRAKGVIEMTGLAFGRNVVWSMPAFANKRVYLRNDKEIICLDLAK